MVLPNIETLKSIFETDLQYRSALGFLWVTIILTAFLLILCMYNIYRGLII